MSAQMLEVSLLGVGTVLRLERDAWSMVKCLRQATDKYAPTPTPPRCWRNLGSEIRPMGCFILRVITRFIVRRELPSYPYSSRMVGLRGYQLLGTSYQF